MQIDFVSLLGLSLLRYTLKCSSTFGFNINKLLNHLLNTVEKRNVSLKLSSSMTFFKYLYIVYYKIKHIDVPTPDF